LKAPAKAGQGINNGTSEGKLERGVVFSDRPRDSSLDVDGRKDGTIEGLSDGTRDGASEGTTDGISEGTNDGPSEGKLEGGVLFSDRPRETSPDVDGGK
jgi:hypothetical protein